MRDTYLNAEDACSECGITKRQLMYWESFGLVRPTFGKNRYSATDIDRIACLRELITERGLPCAFVKRLVEHRQSTVAYISECANILRYPDAL